jgi:hypothetical protein
VLPMFPMTSCAVRAAKVSVFIESGLFPSYNW